MPHTITSDQMLHLVKRITTAILHIATPGGDVTDMGGWTDFTGLSPAETAGQGWMAVVHDDDKARVARAWQTAKDHGTDYNTEMRVRHRDGSYRWCGARAVPNYDSDGNLRGWIAFLLPLAGGLRHGAEEKSATASSIDPSTLRAARAMLNWSAEDMAREAGISRSTVRRLESEGESQSVHRNTSQLVINALSNAGLRLLVTDHIVDGVRVPHAAAETTNVVSFPQSAIEA